MAKFFLNHRWAARICLGLNVVMFVAMLALLLPALFGIPILGENLIHRQTFIAFPLISLNMLTGILGAKEGVFAFPPLIDPKMATFRQRFGALFNTGSTTRMLTIAFIVIELAFMWGITSFTFLHRVPGSLESMDSKWIYNNHGEITSVASDEVAHAVSLDIVSFVGGMCGFIWLGIGVFYFLAWARVLTPNLSQERQANRNLVK